MAQSLLSPTIITREFLRILHSNVVLSKNVNRVYEDKFASSGVSPSGKIGTSLQIRKPNQYTIRTGWAMANQDLAESYVTLSIDTVRGIDMNFSDSELSLVIDDFSDRYCKPAATRMAAEVDLKLADYMAKNIYQNTYEGSYVAPTTNSTYLKAAQYVKQQLAPIDGGINCVIDPAGEAAIVGGLAGLYNPQNTIGAQFQSGEMSNALGMKWYMSQVLPTLTAGTRTNTNSAISSWSSSTPGSIVITCTSSTTIVAGDTFTLAGVYDVNPETKQTYPTLKSFVCTATTTASSSSATIAFAPAIAVTGPTQNVNAAPVSGAVVFTGTASGNYLQELIFHKDAFTLATVDLELPKGMDMAARASSDGLSCRFVRGYDIVNARYLSRVDMFFGQAALRPEWGCRIYHV